MSIQLIIKDEVNIQITGLPVEVRRKLSNTFKYFDKELTRRGEGWFIRIESPFAKLEHYMCPDDIKIKTGLCRAVWLWSKLPGIKKVINHSVMLPIDRIRQERQRVWHVEL